MAQQSKSSKKWLREHEDDEYVQRARREGLRSRAAYKLAEIDARDKLLRSGMVVADLGAAPGGWSQYAIKKLGPRGCLIALDILEMKPIPGVDFIHGDFTEEAPVKTLLALLDGRPVDLVLSDMAPNISGIGGADQARTMYLVELALDFSAQTLRPGGSLLTKVFQGEGFSEFHRAMKARFDVVRTRKPKASRPRSREVYLLGVGFKGG